MGHSLILITLTALHICSTSEDEHLRFNYFATFAIVMFELPPKVSKILIDHLNVEYDRLNIHILFVLNVL